MKHHLLYDATRIKWSFTYTNVIYNTTSINQVHKNCYLCVSVYCVDFMKIFIVSIMMNNANNANNRRLDEKTTVK